NVDTIAYEIGGIDNDVAEMDADAEPHPVGFGQPGTTPVDLELDFGSTAHRLDGACEFRDDTVAGASEDTACMARDQAVDNLTTHLESGKGSFLILAHQPAVAGDVGCKDGSQSALNTIHSHASLAGEPCGILSEMEKDGEGHLPSRRRSSGATCNSMIRTGITQLSGWL